VAQFEMSAWRFEAEVCHMTRKAKKTSDSTCPITGDPLRRAAANALTAPLKEALPPGLSQPSLRAFAAAKLLRLEDFARVREADLAKLHGVGPKALRILRAALAARGLSLLP